MARKLAANEASAGKEVDMLVVELAALFHDL